MNFKKLKTELKEEWNRKETPEEEYLTMYAGLGFMLAIIPLWIVGMVILFG